MRTYSRQPVLAQVIAGIEGLCRLCLQRADEVVEIYPEYKEDEVFTPLSLRIMLCVGLEISKDQNLPNKICLNCNQEINRFYRFRKCCMSSYLKLKGHLEAFKMKDGTFTESNSEMELKSPILFSYAKNEDSINTYLDHDNVDNLEAVEELSESKMLLVNKSLTDQSEGECKGSGHPESVYLDEKGEAVTTGNIIEESVHIAREPSEAERPRAPTAALAALLAARLTAGGGGGGGRVRLQAAGGELVLMELVEEPEGDPLPYKGISCGVCGARPARRSSLLRHLRRHQPRREPCPQCARAFASRADRARHQLTHSGGPHACALCPRRFTQRGSLEAHERSHAPPQRRPLPLHACPRCPKLFLHASGLSRHGAAHAGRQYPCGVCARRFTDASSLRRHAARHAAEARDTAANSRPHSTPDTAADTQTRTQDNS